MRVVVLVKASEESEAGVMPTEADLAEMGKFNEELVKAGIMLAGEGLHPSSKGVRVQYPERKVVDGPFAETKELVAGFWLCRSSRWTRRSSGSSAPHSRRATSRSGRSSRPRTSVRSSRPSCASRRSGIARRSAGERSRQHPWLAA